MNDTHTNKPEVVKGTTTDVMYNNWCNDFNATITTAQAETLVSLRNKAGLNNLKIEESGCVTGWNGKSYDKNYFCVELNGDKSVWGI